MRALILALAVLGAAPAYAQTPPPPVPSATPAAPTAPAVAPGHRLAAAMLTPAFVDKVMGVFSEQMPQMFDRELGADANYRSLPVATRDKVRLYLIEATPRHLRGIVSGALAETYANAGRELGQSYSAEALEGIAVFFESPDGASMMNKLLGVATTSAIANNGEVTATTRDMMNALSGDEIKALALFTTTPPGEVFARDGEAMFGKIGKAFTDALHARTPEMERQMIAGLCAVLSPAERRRLAIRECRIANP